MDQKKSLLFLNLATFRQTGGIEKVNRSVLKAFNDFASQDSDFKFNAISVYDSDNQVDPRFISPDRNQNCGGSKFSFLLKTAQKFFAADRVLLGHINLLPLIFPFKVLCPFKKIYLYAYGIDVWNLSTLQKKIIQWINPTIISISHFTSQKITEQFQGFTPNIKRITPCLDPFLVVPQKLQKQTGKFNQDKDRFVLLALSRLSAAEMYKGYDRTIEALGKIKQSLPNFLYIIAGKADPEEKLRIEKLIDQAGLKDHVLLTGFVADSDISELFLTADVFVMPSQNEGFGITFIEAGLYGLTNIAGNIDGSRDALLDGKLGELINPNSLDDIGRAIQKVATNPENLSLQNRQQRQQTTLEHFSFESFSRLIQKEIL
ncbi:MAG: glycosyltransferase family 4 protein [Pseudobdellovibrio sp.]|nr:glycosyltransferase family 4 protein [Pseudobdellovibrio sp.]